MDSGPGSVSMPETHCHLVESDGPRDTSGALLLYEQADGLLDEVVKEHDDHLLQQALSYADESFKFLPGSYRLNIFFKLGKILINTFLRQGDPTSLSGAIKILRQVVSAKVMERPDRAAACATLGAALAMHHESDGDDAALTEAIGLQREALALRPEGHSEHATTCCNLANILTIRCANSGSRLDFEEALDLSIKAFFLLHGHPNRVPSLTTLASALHTLYRFEGHVEALDEAIDLEREALALCAQEHSTRALCCRNLATSLVMRYTTTNYKWMLSESITLFREALALSPPGHPYHVVCCNNLAQALLMQYKLTGESQPALEAISLQRKLVELNQQGHPLHVRSCRNLADTLRSRYSKTMDDRILQESLSLERQSLLFLPQEHPDYSEHCIGLASSLELSWLRTKNISLLLEAVELLEGTLSRPPGRPMDRSAHRMHLALLLRHRFNFGPDSDIHVIERAMTLLRELRSASDEEVSNSMRSRACEELADLLMDQYLDPQIHFERLNEINDCAHESLRLTSDRNKWKPELQLCWLHLQENSHFFDVNTAVKYLSRGLTHRPTILTDILSVVTFVVERLDGIWKWSHDSNETRRALDPIYQKLVNLMPLLAHPATETSQQLQVLRNAKSRRVGMDAFINAALAGAWSSGLENLEMVQGLLWSQRVHYRDPHLQALPQPFAAKLQSLLQATPVPREIDDFRASPTLRDVEYHQVMNIYTLLEEIRATPGFEKFMLGENYMDLCSVAKSHPVVVLVSAHSHSFALILVPNGQKPALIPLSWNEREFHDIPSLRAQIRTSRGTSSSLQTTDVPDTAANRALRVKQRMGLSTLERQLRYVWLNVVEPVIRHLNLKPSAGRHRPRLQWCPTGVFSSLPIHAAGIYNSPSQLRVSCADYVVSSYTPTLTTLLRAQKISRTLSRDSCSIALVAEKQSQEPHLQTIPGVETEVADIADVAASHHVPIVHQLSGTTTVTSTCYAMQAVHIVHLACHGIQDSLDATQSGFCLGDGRLTISRLMDLQMSKAFLAFLSACETAKGDDEQPDQVMHLAAAMMFTGFTSVIATMWAITDSDGPVVAKWFYEELFASEIIDADTVAYALDVAVERLREMGVTLDRWVPFIHMGV